MASVGADDMPSRCYDGYSNDVSASAARVRGHPDSMMADIIWWNKGSIES
jgi:hypothetical protein